MQYADRGNLSYYLDRHINELTRRRKLVYLRNIVNNLDVIHGSGLIHCDLHGGNVLLDSNSEDESTRPYIRVLIIKACKTPYIRVLGLSQSVDSISRLIQFRFTKHSRRFAICCARSPSYSKIYSGIGYLRCGHYHAPYC